MARDTSLQSPLSPHPLALSLSTSLPLSLSPSRSLSLPPPLCSPLRRIPATTLSLLLVRGLSDSFLFSSPLICLHTT